MQILHVIPDLNPASGGPPMVVSRLAAAQAAQGHAVTLACHDTPPVREQIEGDIRSLPGGKNLNLRFFPEPAGIDRLLAAGAKRTLAPLVEQAQVVHLHGIWSSLLARAAEVARRAGKPYVLAPHGMLDPWALSVKSGKKRLALALGFRRMIGGASALHAHSVYEQECLINGRWHTDARIVPNGVFLDEFRPLPARDAFHRAHPDLQGQPYVLFLARLHEVKGLNLLADAFAAVLPDLSSLRLVVVGPDAGAQDGFVDQVRRLGIADRVHLIGPLYAADKLAAFAGAACFCLPSEHESFGMSVAEAMACGIPVVITENCHFPEVAEVGAGRVVVRKVSAIATGLREVLSNPAAAGAMGRAGQALIEGKYTWERVARASVVMYEELLSGNARTCDRR